ncbi:Alpha/Beta hydrolase protein [Tirmania nivea]|nr:Alpha/Beta hydrolase protein [Tirmania nivea]
MRFLAALLLPVLLLTLPAPASPAEPYPLVIWHGLGDTYTNPALQSLADLYTALYPRAPTHIVALSRRSAPPSSRSPPPFATTRLNLLGLSQGGQFLRALVQTCPLPHPPASLVTFGSQHAGISRFLASCAPADWPCRTTAALLQRNKWSAWAQHNLVPAQYFRDPADLDAYLAHSGFLADINNERPLKNATYKHRLQMLDRFVMYVFEDDTTVVPKESGWFDDVDAQTGEPIKLRESKAYTEDWLGLRTLDEKGALVFETAPGQHMRLADEVVQQAFEKYFAPVEVNPEQAVPASTEEEL